MNEMPKLTVSSSPHIRAAQNTASIMRDVVIALVPALAVAVIMFGMSALMVIVSSVVSCVFFEWGYRKLMKKSNTIGDFSAVVTGVLLACCLPAGVPVWLPVIGGFFAIVVVKQLYGGLGKNFVNPALAGRAFLFSWPVLMTTWQAPNFSYGADVVTSATPMSFLHLGKLPEGISVMGSFLGTIGGSLGEISALALLLGGAYLVWRKVISLRIPASYLLTVAVLTLIFPRGNDPILWMLYNLFGGGLMLGAIFMATDYATSPITPKGQIVYGIGCGCLTVLIRYFGGYVEGVSYAILIMNVCVWLIDRYTMPRRFGVSKEDMQKAKAAKKEAAK
ncbi:MAG: RnfABCDGE type electron transport complex subunit D [Candidatus Heteroscillospira sp.]|jgi:electron transport complex protein RnfD